MNASAAPVSVPVVLTVLHLSLAEMSAPPSTNLRYAPAGHELGFAVADDISAQERHVQSWRASLGHTYADWVQSGPGEH
jgi:hypothetical protein